MIAPAVSAQDLVPKASAFVYTLFKEQLPDHLHFHTYRHAVEVAAAAAKIGRKSGLDDDALALVTVAAWFHDAGYVEKVEGHEEAGARIATSFLHEQGLPEAQVAQVAALIRSTHPDHAPQTPAERVPHDADLIHLGKKKKYALFAERLRKERSYRRDRPYSDREWAEVQLDMLARARFETAYARRRYGKNVARNLRDVQRTLADLLDAPGSVPSAAEEKRVPRRGKETLFRTAYRNHINLSAIADSKANIMISINAILMSIIVSFASTRIQSDPWLLVPSAAMLVTSLAAIVFAILSARPKVTSEVFTLEDVRQNRANILFFGNFVRMSQRDFRVGLKEIIGDWDLLYDSMINDLYGLGQVLAKKYRLLWISFTVFMAGLMVTVALSLVLFFTM